MTSEYLESELVRNPFVPLKLHLASGKTLDIAVARSAWIMPNALLVFQNLRPGGQRVDGYDVIALRNIERIEQLPTEPPPPARN